MGVEIFQPGGLGSFNAAGAASPGTPHVVSKARVYFRLVSANSSYSSSALTKPTGSTSAITNRMVAGLGFSFGFTPDVENDNYTLTITDNLAVQHSITMYCRYPDTPGSYAANATAVNAAWFGGMPNAKFFSSTNGKWYQDAGLTVEASDDAAKLIAAVKYAGALGDSSSDVRGMVYIPAGNWYLKNAPTGASGEFVTVPNGVTIFGDGDASCIRLGPGHLSGTVGYNTVFGCADQTTAGTRNDCRFRNFRVDHNSKFNQMATTGGSGLTYQFAASVLIPRGKRNRIEDVTSINHAGRFNFLIGEYGYLADTDDAAISRCHCYHEGDDPKVGDSSIIVCTANNSHVTDCIVDGDRATNLAWPNGNPITTAFEVHSNNGTFTNNVVRNCGRGLNFAGDSLSQDTFLVQGNLFDDVNSGMTLYQLGTHTITNLTVTDNIIKVRQGTAAFGEAGIAVADPAALSASDGNGIINAKFSRNQIIFTYTITTDPVTGAPVTPGPTSGHSYGMNMLGIANRVEISENTIVGFGTIGILWNVTTRNADSGNLNQDMRIHDNLLYRPGSYGIFLGGKTGESAARLIRTRVDHNRILDDRGGSSALSYGVYVNGRADAFLRIWSNEILGAVTGDIGLDTVSYPTLANLAETIPTNAQVSGNLTVTGSARIGGTSTAQQALHVTGAGLFTSDFIQTGDNSGVAVSWASNEFDVLRDTHKLKSTNGSTTYITVGPSNITPTLPILDATYYTAAKQTDPSAPSANRGVFYLRDNGGGKMQFVARFPSGAVQVIATEP